METLQEWANGLLDKHKDNWDAAVEEGIKTGTRLGIFNPEYLEDFTKPLLIIGIKHLINRTGSERRSHTFNGAGVPTSAKGRTGELDSKRKSGVQKTLFHRVLLDMWLDKSKTFLRDATRGNLIDEANMHTGNARGNDVKRLFYTKLYEGLPEKKTVKDRYTKTEIEKIRDAAHEEVEKQWKSKMLKPPKEDV